MGAPGRDAAALTAQLGLPQSGTLRPPLIPFDQGRLSLLHAPRRDGHLDDLGIGGDVEHDLGHDLLQHRPQATGADIPVDGLLMVSNPSELVSMIVAKTIVMAQKTNTKLLGLVENMAYVLCPDCGKAIYLHGQDDDSANLAKRYNLELLASLPLDTHLALLADEGLIEDYEGHYLAKVVENLEKD